MWYLNKVIKILSSHISSSLLQFFFYNSDSLITYKKYKYFFTLLFFLTACYWPNEIYEPCFSGCAEVTCDNPRNHLRPCYPYCEPGCICEEPYVRDDRTHQCVLPQDCSPLVFICDHHHHGLHRSHNWAQAWFMAI